MRIISALIGALAGPIVLVLLVAAVHPRAGGESWDYGTPLLTIVYAIVASMAGGIAGAAIHAAIRQRNLKHVARITALALLVIGAFPAWLAWGWYGPDRPATPATESEREKWAADRVEFYAQRGFSEQPGLSLATSLRDCIGDGGCRSFDWRRYDRGEDSVAAYGAAYRVGDDGWRWKFVDTWGGPAIVFQDPRLQRPGPIFEVVGRDVFRRAQPADLAFATDSSLAAILMLPSCIERFAERARVNGSWNGEPEMLPALMASHWVAPDGCPPLELYTAHDDARQPWEFAVRGGAAMHMRFLLAPKPAAQNTPFTFSFMTIGRGFMREASGKWHVRNRGAAYASDPPPAACLFDLSKPCERLQ